MKAITIAIIVLLAAAAMAASWSVESCDDTSCSNCTNVITDAMTVTNDCAIDAARNESWKIDCSSGGPNVTFASYQNTACSGNATINLQYKDGCNTVGYHSLKISCGAAAFSSAVAIAVIAALLF